MPEPGGRKLPGRAGLRQAERVGTPTVYPGVAGPRGRAGPGPDRGALTGAPRAANSTGLYGSKPRAAQLDSWSLVRFLGKAARWGRRPEKVGAPEDGTPARRRVPRMRRSR
jgi:hypothetical protein